MASDNLVNRRSVMNLFTGAACPFSHLVRIVLAEKDITFEAIEVDPNVPPEDLSELNPYNTVPTLIDRDLVLYDSRVIVEYLDERFPHPPLMPVDPVTRAHSRLALYRIEKDWYTLLQDIESGEKVKADKARAILKEGVLSAAGVFEHKDYFLSDTFSLIDATIAPILWRLPKYGINVPESAKSILAYMDRVFTRDAFQVALSDAEKAIRP